MNEESKSRYEKLNWWLKNNPVTATLIIIGVVVIGLSTFSNAAQNLLELFKGDNRPDINGEWTAEVTYDWARTTYTESFTFGGSGEELAGFATYLKRKQMIRNGKVNGENIQFTTKTKEFSGEWENTREVSHHYSGIVQGDKILFILQSEGGFSDHSPIEFTAQRVTGND